MSFLSKALSAASPADSLKPELLGSIRVAVVGEPSVGKTALTEVSQLGILLLCRLIVRVEAFVTAAVLWQEAVPHTGGSLCQFGSMFFQTAVGIAVNCST